ncbi:MAG: amidase [Alphaproteobacteria bacterium]|nr:amidase [Alphaproteobacteria bacterium]
MRLHDLTARDIAHGVTQGNFRAEDVVRDCLDHIAARDGKVLAWEYLDADGAIAAARRADAGEHRGLLAGVPFGIKDIFDTADMPTGYGSPIFAGHRPASDAATVALPRRAGAVALGKTVTTEFANVHPGKTHNPFDPTRTPGGSSSGSAAAVGARMVPLALGTQTTASTIRPASFCGTHALVGSFADISCSGIRQASWSLDRPGLFARSIDDLALFRHVLLGERDTPAWPEPLLPRIGFCRTHLWNDVEPSTQAMLEAAAACLGRAGAAVTDISLPDHFAEIPDAHRWISSYEFTRNFTYEVEHHWKRISSTLRQGRLRDGLGCSYQQYRRAWDYAARCRAQVLAVFDEVDVLLTVSAAGEAPAGTATGNPAFGAIWTALHLPSLNLPAFTGPSGLPVGLQLVAAPHRDRELLGCGLWVEQRLG